jgi:signal transduction histidine kinase
MRGSKDPRLVTRFAVASLTAFVTVGVVLAGMVSHQIRTRQELAATSHAQFVTGSILSFELTAQDVAGPIDPTSSRYRELRKVVVDRLLVRPVVRVKIWRADGTIIFSDEPRLIGKQFRPDDELDEATAGTTEAGISNLNEDENIYERGLFAKLYSTYVPLYLGSRPHRGKADAVAELYTDYAGIEAEVHRLFQTLVITLVAGLLALYLLLLPITRRTARTLSGQNAKLEEQAESLQGLLEREQQTVSELRELNRLKDDFVAVASHEVRTPLTSIIGYAKTLRRPEFAEDRSARDEFLAAIERQGDRLHRLVGNLLAAAHVEESQASLAATPTSLHAVTDEVLAGVGPQGRRVRVFLPQDLPDVATDRDRLELILANLVDNALKFSAEESLVDLGARRVGNDIEVWVSDRGIGIEDEHLRRIFDRFYQVDSSVTRRYGGVGLGLHLVQELAQSLGGTVGVLSAPGSGSTFTITLPLGLSSIANDPNRAVEADQVTAKT